MNQETVWANESLIRQLLVAYLQAHRQEETDEQFLLTCLNIVSRTPWGPRAATVKSIVQEAYPEVWVRIEKLLVLK